MVRAKFVLSERHEHSWNPTAKTLVFTPQYDETVEEDRRFSRASPSGRFEMLVDNPAALEQLELGKAYYLDLTPVSV